MCASVSQLTYTRPTLTLTPILSPAAAAAAALGPVTLIFTFVNYIWSQGIATITTLVADALNRPSPDSKHPPHVKAGRVLASSLLMAAVMGAAACTCLQLLGPPRLLQLTGAAPELIDSALSYLRIRALAIPASYGESLPLFSTSMPPPPTHCCCCCFERDRQEGGGIHWRVGLERPSPLVQ